MKKAIILFILSILTCQMFAQSTGQGCVVNPSMVSPSGVKYTGGCLNGLAEGDGTITFSNGNTISGKFSKNILQEGIVEFYFNEDGAIAIGPYKNKKLNGRFVGIDRHQMKVWTSNYVDGNYVGNSDDYFNLPEPQIGETQDFPIFAQSSDPKYPFQSNFQILTLIPTTEFALVEKFGKPTGSKWNVPWLSIYDYRSNQSIRSFGDVNNPIETFLCFDADYSSFYAIQSRKNVKGVYKFNITSGASEFVSRVEDQKVLATSLLVSKSNGFNKYPGFEDGDIQYGEINHNLNLIFSWTNNGMFKLGNMKSTFLVSKLNGEKVNELSFDGAMVRSYAVNELTNQLYISFTSNELEYISLFKLDSLEYVKTIFKGEKNKGFWPLLDIKISPLGTYVAFSQSGSLRGTIIYKGDQFYYAIDGVVKSFNNLENVVLSSSGAIFAHDLENKKILWTTNKVGGHNPIKIDNDIIFITSPNASLAKSKVNKINFEIPDLTETFFSLNLEVQNQLKMISEAERLRKEQELKSQSSGTATNQTTSNPKQTVNVSNSSIDFVRVGKIDIMTKDLGEFNYSQAKNAIQALGEGWRLPNESELLIMFNNQDKIGQLRKKPMLRNQNQIFWGAYLGGSFSNYLVIMNNSVNPGLTYSTYWSENRERLENEFYLVRAVRDVPSKDLRITSEEKKANDDAYTKLVEIIFRKMLTEALSGSSGSSNQSSSFTDRTPSQSGSTSSGLEVCTYCKPNDSKGHWITDYNPYKKTNENGRWVLRPGHKPCDQCYGTGNCKRRNMCLPSVDSDWAMGRNVDLTCNICLGERFQVCKWCDGSGYRRK